MESPHDRDRRDYEKPSDATATLIIIAGAEVDQREYATAHEMFSPDDPRPRHRTDV